MAMSTLPNVQDLINAAADKYGIPREQYSALVWSEMSKSDPVGFTNIGADGNSYTGPAQVGAAAAIDVGVNPATLGDPAVNIDTGAKYFAKLLNDNGGDLTAAVKQYKGIVSDTPANRGMIDSYFGHLGRQAPSGSDQSSVDGEVLKQIGKSIFGGSANKIISEQAAKSQGIDIKTKPPAEDTISIAHFDTGIPKRFLAPEFIILAAFAALLTVVAVTQIAVESAVADSAKSFIAG